MSVSGMSSSMVKRNYKIIFLGDSGVGKTSLIERYINQKYSDSENPTIGIDFLGKVLTHKGSSVRLQLWDTAGQEKFKSLIPTYLKDAICAIFVFDVSRPDTLANIETWIRLYKDHKSMKCISLICGNKSDLKKAFKKQDLEVLMEKYKMPYHSVSAKTADNIEELFYLVLDMITISQDQSFKKVKQGNQEEAIEAPLTKDVLFSHQDQEQKAVKLKQQINSTTKRTCC